MQTCPECKGYLPQHYIYCSIGTNKQEQLDQRFAKFLCQVCCKYHEEGKCLGKIQKPERMPVLAEREKTHGSFADVARVAQALKNVLNAGRHSRLIPQTYSFIQLESEDLICTKLARACMGNPNEPDHWLDIIGYCTLVLESLNKKA